MLSGHDYLSPYFPERASERLRGKIRNPTAAFMADVVNYSLYVAVARALLVGKNVTANAITPTMLLTDLEHHADHESLQPEADAIVRYIRALRTVKRAESIASSA